LRRVGLVACLPLASCAARLARALLRAGRLGRAGRKSLANCHVCVSGNKTQITFQALRRIPPTRLAKLLGEVGLPS
jgi:hypothetical protein